jgi:hypothetical protein
LARILLDLAGMTTSNRPFAVLSMALSLVILGAVPSPAQDEQIVSAPAFLRRAQGEVLVTPDDGGELIEGVANLPLGDGDHVAVGRGARAEVLLPDGTRLRLESEAELVVHTSLREEAQDDAGARAGVGLLAGEIQIVVLAGDGAGDDAVRLEVPGGDLYAAAPGSYLVLVSASGETTAVTREGWIELVTARGSVIVREGEEIRVGRDGWGDIRVASAPRETSLEGWGRTLDEEAVATRSEWLQEDLAYQAAGLEGHGDWVATEQGRAWRPAVASSWRPYDDGYWTYSSRGLFWVSYEPFGWVPYHWGSWDHHARHGWVWFPGAVFRPAHVHWFWGATHTAWIPSGYYRRFHHRSTFRVGVHFDFGHSGYGHHSFWTFCPTRYFGHRHQRRHHGGYDSIRRWTHRDPGRGRLTADTRGLTPDTWRDPARVARRLDAPPAHGKRVDSRRIDSEVRVDRSDERVRVRRQEAVPRRLGEPRGAVGTRPGRVQSADVDFGAGGGRRRGGDTTPPRLGEPKRGGDGGGPSRTQVTRRSYVRSDSDPSPRRLGDARRGSVAVTPVKSEERSRRSFASREAPPARELAGDRGARSSDRRGGGSRVRVVQAQKVGRATPGSRDRKRASTLEQSRGAPKVSRDRERSPSAKAPAVTARRSDVSRGALRENRAGERAGRVSKPPVSTSRGQGVAPRGRSRAPRPVERAAPQRKSQPPKRTQASSGPSKTRDGSGRRDGTSTSRAPKASSGRRGASDRPRSARAGSGRRR